MNLFFSLLPLLCTLPIFVAADSAAPASASSDALTDVTILNYALTLEHLEATFYRAGVANYTHADFLAAGFPDPFYANLLKLAEDESTHVMFLSKALSAAGASSIAPECTYCFPATTPGGFVALAGILEGVGVSAYLGAAADISNGDYLTAAASILAIESRHSSYIRSTLKQKPFAAPFDTPLNPDEVYSLAHVFIESCPSGAPTLPVKAFPALALGPVQESGPITTGSLITIQTVGYVLAPRPGVEKRGRMGRRSEAVVDGEKEKRAAGAPQLHGVFISLNGPIFVDLVPVNVPEGSGFQVKIPPGVAGQSYFLLTNCGERVTRDSIVAGPVVVEVE